MSLLQLACILIACLAPSKSIFNYLFSVLSSSIYPNNFLTTSPSASKALPIVPDGK
jgi:hypothetical protein